VFVTFGGNANSYTLTNDISALTENSFTFSNFGTGTFTLTSTNAFTLSGTNPFINLNGSASTTISGTGGLVLAPTTGTTTFGGNGNSSLTISSIISGSGGLTINRTGNGIVSLTGANTFTGNVTLNSGFLQMGTAASALGNSANTLTITGGAVRYSTGGTFANTIILSNADFVVAGGTGAITGQSTATIGAVTGTGGVLIQTVGSSSGPTMSSVNTYNGPTRIQTFLPQVNATTGALITLSGANGSALNSPSFSLFNNGTLVLGGTTANGNRIADSADVNLHGGRLTYNPVATGTNETFRDLTISGSAHFAGAPAGINTMSARNFIRQGNATIFIDTSTYGTIQSATLANNLVFTGATTPLADVYAVGVGTGTETGVLPYAVGGSSNNPSHFVTYNPTDGLAIILRTDATRVVQQAPGTMVAAALLNKNVNFIGNGTYTFTGNYTINALSTTTSTVTFAGTGTLTVASGTLVNFDSFFVNGPTIAFDTRTGYWFNSWLSTVSGTSSITGSNGLVISSGTATAFNFQNTVANTFTGGLTLNGNLNLGYTNDNQLGNAAGSVTMAGGVLAYNSAASYTFTRNIIIEQTNGGFAFNRTNSTATTGAATATTAVTINGSVTGAGAFVKDGVGIVNLANNTNSYAGGTMITTGTLRYTVDGNLGAANSRIVLNGGTLEALATVATARPIQINASSTLLSGTGVVATYGGAFNNVGTLFGTALPTLNIAGGGSTVLTGASPLMSGAVAIGAGANLQVSGSGTLAKISSITVPSTARLDVDDTTYTANRFAPQTSLSVGGGLVNYTAGSTATGLTAQQLGNLIITAAGSVVNLDGTAATTDTNLRFGNLVVSSGSVTLRGTNLGAIASPATRIFFDAFTTNVSLLPNVFFDNTSGTGTSLTPTGYDTVRGIIAFAPTIVSGTVINNFAPDNVPTTAAFTTTGDATAITGVQIFSLTLDGGTTLALIGGNAASGTNGNTPEGTLSISGGSLTSQNGAKTITSVVARIIAIGASAGTVTTTSDLTTDANVSITGTGGFTKAGAGVLTINGTYSVTGPLAVNAGTIAFGTTTTVGSLSGTGTVASAAPLTVNSTTATTFSGVFNLTGAATFTKSGTGVFTLTPSNLLAFSGATTISGGTLVIGNANAAPILTNYALSGGTIDINGQAATAAVPTLTGTANGVTNSNTTTPVTIAIDTPTATTLPVAFSGNVVVNKIGTDTLALTGTGGIANTTTIGVVNVQEGTLQLNGSNQGLGAGMAINVASGATFRLNGASSTNVNNPFGMVTIGAGGQFLNNGTGFFDPYLNGLTLGSGAVVSETTTALSFYHLQTLNGVTPSITTLAGPATTTFVVSSTGDQIQNNSVLPLPINVAKGTAPSGIDVEFNVAFKSGTTLAVNKLGAGAMALTGFASASTYAFNVNVGSLLANGIGTGTGALTVNNTGTLGGTGTATGAITVASGGTIAPGSPIAPGTLTTSAAVTFNTSSSFTVRLNGIVAGEFDVLSGTGIIALGSGANLNLTLGYAPSVGDTFTVVTTTGSRTGTFFNAPNSGDIVTANYLSTDYIFSVNYSGNSVVIAVVPEPCSILAVSGLALGGVRWVRRRRAAKVQA